MEMDLLRVKLQASATNEALIRIEANVIHTKVLHDPNLPPHTSTAPPTTCNPSCISFNLSLTLHISVMFDSSFWRVYFSLSYLKVFEYAVPFPRTLFSLPLSGIHMVILQGCGINKDQSNEKKQRLFIHSLLWQGSQPPSLEFWHRLKSRQRSGKAL